MRLFLSHVPDDFDTEVDVAAGPWCFVSRPNDFEVLAGLDFVPEFGELGMDYRVAMDACGLYAKRMLARMSPELNRLNSVDHSPRFWEIMGIFWMLSLLQTVFLAQEKARLLRERYATHPLEVELISGEEGWLCADTGAFSGLVHYSTDFFGWMLSRFLEKDLPVSWTISRRPPSRLAAPPLQDGFRGLLQRFKWIVRMLITPRCLGVYGIRGWRAWLLSVLLSLKVPVVVQQVVQPSEPGPNEPEQWLAPMTEDEFLSLAWQTLPASLRNVNLLPKAPWFRRKGKIRLLGGSLLSAIEEVKFAVAECLESGERVICAQHGAVYGDGRQSMSPYVEYNQDAFLTWGWRTYEHFYGHFIPLPSPLLSGCPSHREMDEALIFVGQVVSLLKPRLDCTPDSKGFIRYVLLKKAFMAVLSPLIFNKLCYRNQPLLGTLDDGPFLRKYFPTLNILDHYPEKQLYSCRLLVMDNPSTTLHKALSSNVPTICYWSRHEWQMTREAETYYDGLRDAGILFDDPESAAEQVNRVWDNVQGWWCSDKVQGARSAWCNQYAQADADWFSTWAKTLWNIREL